MENKTKTLTIFYHCHPGCPQIVSYCDIVNSLEDYRYPENEEPVIVSLNQEIPYIDAELKERTATKTVRYILGKEVPADRTLTFAPGSLYETEEFLEKYPESKVINYTSPNGKVYVTPKTDCTKAFKSQSDLKAGVDKFVAEFLELTNTKREESQKVYTK